MQAATNLGRVYFISLRVYFISLKELPQEIALAQLCKIAWLGFIQLSFIPFSDLQNTRIMLVSCICIASGNV